ANLSALYRHTILLRALALPPDQYVAFMRLGGFMRSTLTIADVRMVFAQTAWLKTAGATVYQLDYFLNGTVSPFIDPLYRADAVAAWLDAARQATGGLPQDQQNERLASLLAALFKIPTDTLASLMRLVVKAAPPDNWQKALIASGEDSA